MRYHWLLDNGHGGIVDGKYTTAPNFDVNNPKTWKKSHVTGGKIIFEGVCNRQIVDKIAKKLCQAGIDHTVIVPEDEDVPLSERVKRANALHRRTRNCVFVSVHGNAFNDEAFGWEVFTSPGLTKSDGIATVFFEEAEKMFPNKKMRPGYGQGDPKKKEDTNDPDKEARFTVLVDTICPAILTENFFFDNEEDAKIFATEEGQEKIAQAHVNAILRIEGLIR